MFHFLSLLLFLFSSCLTSKSKQANRYVVVLSMDGFRSDYPERANTPTLDSLASVGVRSAFRPCFPSVTFPNHYSMATGLHPDHHGLINNFFYASDLDSIYRLGNDEAVLNPNFYGGEPIWNTAEKQGVRTASFFWVGSETAVQGGQPSTWKKFDKMVSFIDRADSVIAWLQLPKEDRPHLVMWYIEEPDAIGHRCTPDSSATLQKVEELDGVLNHFFTEARKLDIFNQIDFIVLSDHGMATYLPENLVNLNDYLPRDSFDYIFDGVPTLLYPKASYTDSAYAILQRVPRVTAWKKNEIPEKYVYGSNPRIGDLVVMPDVGTYIQFRPVSSSSLHNGGTHGYDNFAPEMEAIFYAAGPSFKRQATVPVMANVNLYLLIARLLNLTPAPNDGDNKAVKQLLR
ncbi:MAG: ectonucleotide pyrophosphatase/phosphodiesterase [Tannerellaceae bacterium]